MLRVSYTMPIQFGMDVKPQFGYRKGQLKFGMDVKPQFSYRKGRL